MRQIAVIHCASLVAARGANVNMGELKLSPGIENDNVGVPVAAERNARVTFTSQSAASFGGVEKDWPSLNMSIEDSSMNVECTAPPDSTGFEVKVEKYADL